MHSFTGLLRRAARAWAGCSPLAWGRGEQWAAWLPAGRAPPKPGRRGLLGAN